MPIYRLGSGPFDRDPMLIDWATKTFAYARAAPLSCVARQPRLPKRGGR
jgi:hypothetical protein